MTTHGHAPGPGPSDRSRLAAVLAISGSLLVIQVIGAVVSGSLALLADAGHLLVDVSGMGLSLLAMRVARRPPSAARTFGHQRFEILAAFANALLLFVVAIAILAEAVRRLTSPPDLQGGLVIAFGVVALAGNAASLMLLRRRHPANMNLRAAFLEVASDALGAAAVIVAGIVIATAGFLRADPIASILIAGFILPRTWRLLRDTIDVLLEATPRGMDLREVRRHLLEVDGVVDVHDLHAWTITSGVNVLSVHVVKSPDADAGRVLDALKDCVGGHFDVEHSTFQIEAPEHRGHEGALHA
jgi:cobalt-zinc-cadmium efflux system protein